MKSAQFLVFVGKTAHVEGVRVGNLPTKSAQLLVFVGKTTYIRGTENEKIQPGTVDMRIQAVFSLKPAGISPK